MEVPSTTGSGAAGVMNGTGKADVGEERKQVPALCEPTITLPAYIHRHAHSVYDAPLAHRVVLSLLVLKVV